LAIQTLKYNLRVKYQYLWDCLVCTSEAMQFFCTSFPCLIYKAKAFKKPHFAPKLPKYHKPPRLCSKHSAARPGARLPPAFNPWALSYGSDGSLLHTCASRVSSRAGSFSLLQRCRLRGHLGPKETYFHAPISSLSVEARNAAPCTDFPFLISHTGRLSAYRERGMPKFHCRSHTLLFW